MQNPNLGSISVGPLNALCQSFVGSVYTDTRITCQVPTGDVNDNVNVYLGSCWGTRISLDESQTCYMLITVAFSMVSRSRCKSGCATHRSGYQHHD